MDQLFAAPSGAGFSLPRLLPQADRHVQNPGKSRLGAVNRFINTAFIILAFGWLPSSLPARSAQTKLIVQITMDQLRGDLLRNYAGALGDGFTRLENGGYWIKRGDVDHGLTMSFPGHTTLSTGMYPSHHGLTANEWWIQGDGRWSSVDVTDDPGFRILGRTEKIGASPKYLHGTTIGEWVKKADSRSKAISLGTGERIPMAYAGHDADAVYWFDSRTNQFTTSTFYAKTILGWVKAFNEDELPGFEERQWSLSVPRQFIGLARSDLLFDEGVRNKPFPHIYDNESVTAAGQPRPYPRWFSVTPMKDDALFALAARAVDAERLGQRGVIDYLAIDVDATDNVGHKYGPRSLEQLDTLVHLDHALGHFLDHLDAVVGKNNYVLALAADHGVADPPELRPGGRRVTTPEIEALLDRVEQIATTNRASRQELIDRIVAELKQSDFVADVYTEDRLSAPSDDRYVQLYQHSFSRGSTTDFPLWSNKVREHHPARYGITVRFNEGMIFDAAVGVHGSPYGYDRDVPIIFYGANIRHGSSEDGGRTVDVAPTLSAAIGLKPPTRLDGHPLRFVLVP
jgi:predicted AlkP superfamily pyrophosphatase or phosphodiesterase